MHMPFLFAAIRPHRKIRHRYIREFELTSEPPSHEKTRSFCDSPSMIAAAAFRYCAALFQQLQL